MHFGMHRGHGQAGHAGHGGGCGGGGHAQHGRETQDRLAGGTTHEGPEPPAAEAEAEVPAWGTPQTSTITVPTSANGETAAGHESHRRRGC
jgi:hypothetical protein